MIPHHRANPVVREEMKQIRHISKQFCEQCADLPEGEVVAGHDHTNDYDVFVRQGRAAGFLDDQIDFLADWMEISDGKELKK